MGLSKKPSWQGETSASLLAALAHQGQTDHQGVPYVAHPKRVVERLRESDRFQALSQREQDVAIQAAWMHDVLEDHPTITTDTLEDLGVPRRVVEVVLLLTKIRGESREYYLTELATDRTALAVKWADHWVNSDPQRNLALEQVDAPRAKRLRDKYERDREVLLSAEKGRG